MVFSKTYNIALSTAEDSFAFSVVLVLMVVLGVMIFFVLGGYFGAKMRAANSNKSKIPPGATESTFGSKLLRSKMYEIRAPSWLDWDPDKSIVLMKHLLGIFGSDSVIFRIVVESGRIAWQIVDCGSQSQETQLVIQGVRSIYPQAEVTASEYQPFQFLGPVHRLVIPYTLKSDFFCPIKAVDQMKKSDPLVALVHAMAAAANEGGRFLYTVAVVKRTSRVKIQSGITQIQRVNLHPLQLLSTAGWADVAGKAIAGKTMTAKYVPEQQKIFEQKLRNEVLYDAYAALQFDIKDEQDLERMLNAATILEQQFDTDLTGLRSYFDKADPYRWHVTSAEEEARTNTLALVGSWIGDVDKRGAVLRAILSVPELAALWHLPHSLFASPEINWIPKGHVVAPPALIKNSDGVLIGNNLVGGRPTPIYLPDASRQSHVNIIGKTQVGKSTFMHNLIHQDIAAGKGVGVIDPHGTLIQDILRSSIPANRVKDVVLIDIANEDFPPPLNLLSIAGEYAVGQTTTILEQLYGEFVKVGDVLRAALLTLQVEPHPTLRDVPRVLSDPEYRHQLLRQVENPAVLDFWQEFEGQSASVQRETIAPVSRRIRSFYANPVLYPIICHPDSLDYDKLIAERKILLVNLQCDDRKVPPRERRLLGTVLVSHLQMAAMSVQQVTPFYLYIDEVQEFVTTSLDEMLPQVRKFGLYLTIANQFLGQLRGSTLEAVTGNIGATIAFQLGPDDARSMAPHFRPEFDVDDLVNLDLHQAAVKIRLGTKTLPAFAINTLPAVAEPSNAAHVAAAIRQSSIDHATPKSRKQVLEWLEQRYPRPGFVSSGKGANSTDGDDWLVPPGPDS
jgi:hypothetical protein